MTDYEKKILLAAAEICELYACKISNSSCDDWEGEKLSFTKEETQSLLYNYQLVNSEGEDYDPEDISISSGVLLGSAIGQALLKIAEGQAIASPPIN